jgi:E3 ubiquitin-protein ligase DOA10
MDHHSASVGFDDEMPPLNPVDVCRVCRVEAEEDNPMVHPCKCSGSVKFVHADWYVLALSPPRAVGRRR